MRQLSVAPTKRSFGLFSRWAMSETETALTKLQAVSKKSAFNEWLGIEVTDASEGSAAQSCNWPGAVS